MYRLLFLLAILAVPAWAQSPKSVTVVYDDGQSVQRTEPFTSAEIEAIKSFAPPLPPPAVTNLQVLRLPEEVLDQGGDDRADLVLGESDRIYLQALTTGPVAKVLFTINAGDPYEEKTAPWTYGLHFNPQGWAAAAGTYTVVATPLDAAGKAGMSKTVVVTVRRPPPASTAPVRLTGTERDGKPSWQLPVDAEGWTVFPIAADAVQVYVSPTGNDQSPGSETQPMKTPAAAVKQAKPGRQFVMYLKSGSSFGTLPNVPSGTPEYPTVVRAWGKGRVSVNRILLMRQRCIALVDLQIVGDGVPIAAGDENSGVYGYEVRNIWVEGCALSENRTGLLFQGNNWTTDIVLRRNVVFDNHADPRNKSHSQGLYAYRVDGLLDEGNYYVRNGWKSGYAGPTMFNHNRYVTGTTKNCIVRDLYTAEAAATGSQSRSGGPHSWVVSVDNPNHLNLGLVNGDGHPTEGGATGDVSHVLLQGSREMRDHGMGLQLANYKSATLSDVLILDIPSWAVYLSSGHGAHENEAIGLHGITMTGLKLDRIGGGVAQELSLVRSPTLKKDSVSRFVIDSSWTPKNSSKLKVVDFTAPLSGRFKEKRDLDAYARSIGLPNRAALTKAVLTQSRSSWNAKLEPRTMLQWIESGWESTP